MEKKICRICGLEKEVFNFRVFGKYTRSECKECENKRNKERNLKNIEHIKIKQKEYREKNKDKIKLYKKENYDSEKMKIYNKNYRQEHKEYYSNWHRKYSKIHREQIRKNEAKWRNDNREKYRYYQKKDSIRRKNNPILKLELQLRNMINTSFKRKGKYKSQKLELICGICSKDLVSYLLETYKQNYNEEWDGKEKVHIDHIKPLKTATTEEEVIKLCHFSNLQLLKAQDNLQKSDKLDWNLQIAN